MATASITDNNTIFEELCKKTHLFGKYYLTEATILNPYLITTLPGSNMIRCVYKAWKSNKGFVLKFEDNREKMACILNQMMDMSRSSSERINCLPAEIVHHIATYLGSERSSEHSSEPKSHYTPEDFSPYYQLKYKGPLPDFITLKDLIILYKLGHVDLVYTIGNYWDNIEKFFVMSEEAYNSHLNPDMDKDYKNIEEMKYGIESLLTFMTNIN